MAALKNSISLPSVYSSSSSSSSSSSPKDDIESSSSSSTSSTLLSSFSFLNLPPPLSFRSAHLFASAFAASRGVDEEKLCFLRLALEELWEALGHSDSVTKAAFPEFNPALIVEDSVKYPVSFNGKMRFTVDLPKSASPAEVEAAVKALPDTARYVGDQTIVKVIVVPGRIVNIVLK